MSTHAHAFKLDYLSVRNATNYATNSDIDITAAFKWNLPAEVEYAISLPSRPIWKAIHDVVNENGYWAVHPGVHGIEWGFK
jgi:hypothetical protein